MAKKLELRDMYANTGVRLVLAKRKETK